MYAVRVGQTVKVGRTKNPQRRFRTYWTIAAAEMDTIGVRQAENVVQAERVPKSCVKRYRDPFTHELYLISDAVADIGDAVSATPKRGDAR